MQFLSPIISEFGRSTGLATPGPFDSAIEIPASLVPTIPLTSPEQIPCNLGDIVSRSFSRVADTSVTNSAAITTPIVTLTPGLWKLQANISFEANFANANPIALDGVFAYAYTDALAIENIVWKSAARISRITVPIESFVILLEKNCRLAHKTGANGVGQTTTLEIFLRGTRLS